MTTEAPDDTLAIDLPEPTPDEPDVARTAALAPALEALLPALDAFERFEGPDRAAPRSAWLPLLDEPLPQDGVGAEAVLETLRDVVIPRGLRTGIPGFSGWVTTSPTTTGTAAHLAQTVASPQRWWAQPGNHLDAMAARWLIELLGFPSSFAAAFTAGGSTANLIALGVARQHAAERIGIDAAAGGVGAVPEPRVYASSETHRIVHRAVGILGLGRENVRTVPLTSERRADLEQLRSAIDEDLTAGRTPIAVVGNAGDVNMGMVDPLEEMAAIAHEHGIWFHADGAYGGWGLLDERVAPAFGDISQIDSFAVDPHKWMAVPIGTGLTICRDGELWRRAFTVEPGSYDSEREGAGSIERDDVDSAWTTPGSGTADWGLDFSAPARGMAVWAVLKEIGASGMRERVRRHDDYARALAERARSEPELELLAEPMLSICCFRYRPSGWDDEERLERLNVDILAELRRGGRSVPSFTRVDGRYCLRACYINPRTRRSDVDVLADDVLTIGPELSAS